MFKFVLISVLISLNQAKIFDRCELAKLLKNADIAGDKLNKWVCIGQQVGLDSGKISLNENGVGYYGIFQISDEYWCSNKGTDKICGLSCKKLVDDNITDDIACALIIYNEHEKMNNDGFSAWIPWMPSCKNADENYLHDCQLGVSDILSIDWRFGPDDNETTGGNKIVSTNTTTATDNDIITFVN